MRNGLARDARKAAATKLRGSTGTTAKAKVKMEWDKLVPREKPVPQRPMNPKGEKSWKAIIKEMNEVAKRSRYPRPGSKPGNPNVKVPPTAPRPIEHGKSNYGAATLKSRPSTNIEDRRGREPKDQVFKRAVRATRAEKK